MAAADPLFGWDLTFKTVQKDIKRKSDVIIAFIHWNLTKRGFRSIGVGDEVGICRRTTLTGDENKSELIPDNWNEKDNYSLRYVLENKLFILHGLVTDGSLIINLVRCEDLVVTNIALNINDTVKEIDGPIDNMMPNYNDLIYNIKRDLIDIVTERSTSTVETQTVRTVHSPDDPLRNLPRMVPNANPDNPDLWEPPRVGPSDLDPFAPGGGGMIFNPFQPRRDIENPGLGVPGGLPRGAVPPGARFDPFGPPGGPIPLRRPAPPDADHLPPPGFNDNMFMLVPALCADIHCKDRLHKPISGAPTLELLGVEVVAMAEKTVGKLYSDPHGKDGSLDAGGYGPVALEYDWRGLCSAVDNYGPK